MTPAERYQHRKANRLCVQCAAGLQSTDHGVRCLECAEADRSSPTKAARDARHRATPARRAYQADRAAVDYKAAAEAKVCADHGCNTPVSRFRRCAACRKKRARWNAAYRERLQHAEGRA